MQLKQVGQRLKLLRAEYDPSVTRSVQTMVGSIHVDATEIPADLRGKLKDAEIRQVEAWIRARPNFHVREDMKAFVAAADAVQLRAAEGSLNAAEKASMIAKAKALIEALADA